MQMQMQMLPQLQLFHLLKLIFVHLATLEISQILPSLDDDPYFSYPNLFSQQSSNVGSQIVAVPLMICDRELSFNHSFDSGSLAPECCLHFMPDVSVHKQTIALHVKDPPVLKYSIHLSPGVAGSSAGTRLIKSPSKSGSGTAGGGDGSATDAGVETAPLAGFAEDDSEYAVSLPSGYSSSSAFWAEVCARVTNASGGL
ncbi:hypothetical protein Ahy_A03g014240 isoform A [Arachis hypogaea]|uniref:Uncharacterized protein n=1 Tax=Arachis hypogaea TaxID=3818 RepID=A0A445DXB4_ARAHY|nr:hypothetical protein Ahy_A03g014240 isoform A [Arachis hypogaea]